VAAVVGAVDVEVGVGIDVVAGVEADVERVGVGVVADVERVGVGVVVGVEVGVVAGVAAGVAEVVDEGFGEVEVVEVVEVVVAMGETVEEEIVVRF
jgi:hypothetical protein